MNAVNRNQTARMPRACAIASTTAIVLASIGTASCGGDDVHACTQAGCESFGVLKQGIVGTPEDFANAEYSICRNDECISGTLDPQESTNGLFGSQLDQSDEGRLWLAIDSAASGGTVTATMTWESFDPRELRDGDTYRVTITASTGLTLWDVTKAVEYNEIYPNGPDCGGVCRQAIVEL